MSCCLSAVVPGPAVPGPAPSAVPAVRGWNGTMFRDVNDFARATPWLHGLMWGYAVYGVALFVALVTAGWWWARRRADPAAMAAALWTPLAALLALLINEPISDTVREARPERSLPGILVLDGHRTDYAFPSDHATMAAAVAAGVCLVAWQLGVVAVVAAALMAFARVYVALHYPSDVVAGLIVGVLVTVLGWWLLRRVLTASVVRLSGTQLRRLLTAERPARR